jgi:hypothetical protein
MGVYLIIFNYRVWFCFYDSRHQLRMEIGFNSDSEKLMLFMLLG